MNTLKNLKQYEKHSSKTINHLTCDTSNIKQVYKVGGLNKANRIIKIQGKREKLEEQFLTTAKQAKKAEGLQARQDKNKQQHAKNKDRRAMFKAKRQAKAKAKK